MKALVEEQPIGHEWGSLPPDLQESACAEFLRYHDIEQYPKLSFLMLPVGRTLKDIDIYGIQQDGTEIFAQVTYYKKDDPESQRKVDDLKRYHEKKGAS